MTREEARAYFWDKGLRYFDITLTDLHLLSSLLNLHFSKQRAERIEAQRREENAKPVYWLRVNEAKYYKGMWAPEGTLLRAFITGKGPYFTAREVISFYEDGFIAFCGDADPKNTEPVLAAFVEWCDKMAEIKAVTVE